MFTKKIALFGLAGLTAFAMSCSDSDDELAGGVFNPALSVTDGATGVELGGIIVANEGSIVTGVTITANGTPISFVPALTGINTGVVSLEGFGTSSVCTALNASAAIPSLKITVTASFDVGAPIEDEKTLTNYACGGGGTPLTKYTIDLSESAASFADVDAGAKYTRATLTKTNVKDVDLIARFSSDVTPGGKIYTPLIAEVPMGTGQIYAGTTDLFFDVHNEFCPEGLNVTATCSYSPYFVFGFTIPPEGITALRGMTNVEDLMPFLEYVDAATDGEPEYEFSGAANSGFILMTSKKQLVAVIVSATGNTATAVTLNTVSMPSGN